MGRFDFITDESFRDSLERDYREMTGAYESSLWKATHVLAGSIVEAVLIDFLIAAAHVTRDDGLKMDLAAAIVLAREKKVIDARAADLSTVVRSYRNLIHPGRAIRLQEAVDSNSARVATALVELICDAVVSVRQNKYGYTAEQIVAKLERDSTAESIIPHLLRDAKEVERERLLLRVLPARLMQIDAFAPDHLRRAIQVCFRVALGTVPEAVQKRVAQRFVEIVKEESDTVVAEYGAAFFAADQFRYLDPDDIGLVKEHLFGRLRRDRDGRSFSMFRGIGKFLSSTDAYRVADALVRIVALSDDPQIDNDVYAFFSELTSTTSTEFDEAARKRLNIVVKRSEAAGQSASATAAKELLERIDLPF
jgi:hypothetical protein